MAVFRVRAVAVAAGVPATFAMLAGLLTVASPMTVATAAEPVVAAPAAPAADVRAVVRGGTWSVTRDLVRTTRPPMAVSFAVRSADPVAFITIDDGVTKDMRGLRFVEENRLPVTAFVSAWTVKDRARYFQRITRWGSVQNHSATHASLARSATDLDHEICYSQRALARSFGARPWMLRPPYGAGYSRQETQVTAARCGISEFVMWDAVVEDGRLTEVGNGLRPGAIVLLHFTPRLEEDLRAAVKAMRKAGLAPADLAEYLPPASDLAAP
jgi:peptidoglycan/xylan/chitin deacetylase (PgdA/CDA1 family)